MDALARRVAQAGLRGRAGGGRFAGGGDSEAGPGGGPRRRLPRRRLRRLQPQQQAPGLRLLQPLGRAFRRTAVLAERPADREGRLLREPLWGDARRPRQDPGRLRRQHPHLVPAQLLGHARADALRRLLDGADAGGARGRLLPRSTRPSTIRSPASPSRTTRSRRTASTPRPATCSSSCRCRTRPGSSRTSTTSPPPRTTSDQVTLRLTHSLARAPSAPRAGRRAAAGPGGRGAGFRRPSLSAAADLSPLERRGHAELPDARRLDALLELGRAGLAAASRPAASSTSSASTTTATARTGQNIFADVARRRRRGGNPGRVDRSLRLGRAEPVVHARLPSLRDRNPSFRLDQRFSVGDVATLHAAASTTLRFGGGFRTQSLDSETDANARGSFVFTGLYTTGVAGGAADPRHRLRPRGLPARPRAAGLGPVRPRPGLLPRQRVEPVPAGRLAAARATSR